MFLARPVAAHRLRQERHQVLSVRRRPAVRGANRRWPRWSATTPIVPRRAGSRRDRQSARRSASSAHPAAPARRSTAPSTSRLLRARVDRHITWWNSRAAQPPSPPLARGVSPRSRSQRPLTDVCAAHVPAAGRDLVMSPGVVTHAAATDLVCRGDRSALVVTASAGFMVSDDRCSVFGMLAWRSHEPAALLLVDTRRYRPVGYVSGVSPSTHRLVTSSGSSARVRSM